ncbi:DUF1971 domain-containing protein [Sphingobium vermicomposti]|uniref:Tellurite resistance-related uncharacterized protein n=1 Tax=Sphingobium vermicomposti TaxID=529005 RepID=A0A846M6N4_9SPHN|nr:tellurite resistance-related uncharacterized protein [Sphingobium vermicomposti]
MHDWSGCRGRWPGDIRSAACKPCSRFLRACAGGPATRPRIQRQSVSSRLRKWPIICNLLSSSERPISLKLAVGEAKRREGAVAEPLPYRSTPVFVQGTLANALHVRHDTKFGVLGLTRVLEGHLKSHISASAVRNSSHAYPRARHSATIAILTPLGDMKMQLDSYDQKPFPTKSWPINQRRSCHVATSE